MRVAVIGGTGLAGRHVVTALQRSGHDVTVAARATGVNVLTGAGLADALAGVDAVIDFTTPDAVMTNIEATLRAGANMVVGTTGWYKEMPHVRNQVERAGTGFIWASNFSMGVNLFFAMVREAAKAVKYGYEPRIVETQHEHKLDAPSGSAVSLAKTAEQFGGKKPQIRSIREGEAIGTHTFELVSQGDKITLTHEALNRRGFAEGAVRAAEWIKGKRGFYEFQEIFSQLKS
jgi:4-hydroxy-tetrahydrodipicolinate reductase